MNITPEQAKVELAKRELARRGVPVSENKPNIVNKIGDAIGAQGALETTTGAVNTLVRGAAEPLVKSFGAAGLGLTDIARGDQTAPEYNVPFVGGDIPVRRMKSWGEAIGTGIQGGALATGNPTLGGAMFGGGGAIAEGDNPLMVALKTAGGAGLGFGLGKLFGAKSTKLEEKIIDLGLKAKEKLTPKLFKNLSNVNQELKVAQKEFGATDVPLSRLTSRIQDRITNFTTQATKLKDSFKQIIETEAERGSSAIKPKLRQFADDLHSNYGQVQDDIEHIITHQDTPIITTNGDLANGFIERSLAKVKGDVEATDKIMKAAQGRGFVVNPMDDGMGGIEYRVYHPDQVGEVGIKDAIELKNSLRPKISTTGKKGVGFQRSDNAYRAVNDSFTEFVTDKYPQAVGEKYVQLQKDYGVLANAKWKAFGIFKPYDLQDISLKQGASFLKDVTVGDYNLDKQNLLNLIEKGSDFSSGIGTETSERLGSLRDLKVKSEKDLTTLINNTLKKKDIVEDLMAKKQELETRRKWLLGFFGTGVGVEEIARRTLLRRR